MTQTPSPNANPNQPTPTPASPTPQEGPSPIRVGPLKFRTPPSSPSPSPEGPEAGGPVGPGQPPASSDTPRAPKPTKTGSSPASSVVDPKILREGIEGTVYAITGQLHELLARDAYDQWAQIYLADKEDAKGFANPGSAILSRHTGDVTGGNPDVADGIAIGIAAAFYIVKQLGRLLRAKRARRAGLDLNAPPPPEAARSDPTANGAAA